MYRNTQTFERIKYDREKDEFYIQKYGLDNVEIERLPLSAWGFVREISVNVIVIREIQNIGTFQQPTRLIYYVLPIKYTIDSRFKEFYLKTETKKDEFDRVFVRVYLRDIDVGSCVECPIPNQLYQKEAYPALLVEKGRERRIKKEELETLLKNGNVLGIFDSSLQNKRV